MEWAAIIQLVVSILAMILEFLGGGHFDRVMTPDQQVSYHLASYQWNCSAPTWTTPTASTGSNYQGTVEMKCQVEGTNGGGIVTLWNHMIQQVNRNAAHMYEGPLVKNFQGLPSQEFDHSVLMAGKDNVEFELRGETNIATNGFTELRNVFHATEIPTEGNMHYLKGFDEEIRVQKSEGRDGWYTVTVRSTNTVSKPWYVSSETFKEALQKTMVEKMEGRRERVMNDLASQL